MARKQRKLSASEKRARKERKKRYKTIFLNGKQVRVPREPTIEGIPVDEFIARNADPIFLHENEMWELMPTEGQTPEMQDDQDLLPPSMPPDDNRTEPRPEASEGRSHTPSQITDIELPF